MRYNIRYRLSDNLYEVIDSQTNLTVAIDEPRHINLLYQLFIGAL